MKDPREERKMNRDDNGRCFREIPMLKVLNLRRTNWYAASSWFGRYKPCLDYECNVLMRPQQTPGNTELGACLCHRVLPCLLLTATIAATLVIIPERAILSWYSYSGCRISKAWRDPCFFHWTSSTFSALRLAKRWDATPGVAYRYSAFYLHLQKLTGTLS